MIRASFAAVCLTIASLFPLRAGAQTEQLRVVNLMPAFLTAWDRGAGKPVEERIQLFKTLVIYPNRPAYDSTEFRLDDAHLAWYLDQVGPYVPEMRRMTSQITGALPSAERAFVAAFPDLKPVTVYFMPSLLRFDGQTRSGTLFFGVDGMVAFEGPNASIPVVATHELFHVYHFQVNPHGFAESGSTGGTVAAQAWSEGLATYVSARLNPGATRQQVLLSTELAELPQAKIKELACAMEPKLASTASADANPFFDLGAHPAGLPARGGYLIGLLAAEQAGRSRSLRELARMDLGEVTTVVAASVHGLCAGAAKGS